MTESATELLARLLYVSGVTVSRGRAIELAFDLITVMEEEGYSIVSKSSAIS